MSLIRGEINAVPFNVRNTVLGAVAPDNVVEAVVLVNGVDDPSIVTTVTFPSPDVAIVVYTIPQNAADGDDHNVRLVLERDGNVIPLTKEADRVGVDITSRLDAQGEILQQLRTDLATVNNFLDGEPDSSAPCIPASLEASAGYQGSEPAPSVQGTVHIINTSSDLSNFPTITTGPTTSTIADGDTVAFASGTYPTLGSLTIATNNVFYIAGAAQFVNTTFTVTGNNNIFHGIGSADSSRFLIEGANTTIQNTVMRGDGTNTAIRVFAPNFRLIDVEIDGYLSAITTPGVSPGSIDATGALFQHVTIRNLRLAGGGQNLTGKAFGISGDITLGIPTAWTIEDCLIENNSTEPELLEIKSSGNTFRRCVIRNNPDGHPSFRQGSNNTIEDCWFENNNSFAGVRFNGDGNVVRGNVFIGPGSGNAIQFFAEVLEQDGVTVAEPGSNNNIIENNVFSEWTRFLRSFYQLSGGIRGAIPSGNIIRNNYLFDIGPLSYLNGAIEVDSNDFFSNNTVGPQTSLVVGDPVAPGIVIPAGLESWFDLALLECLSGSTETDIQQRLDAQDECLDDVKETLQNLIPVPGSSGVVTTAPPPTPFSTADGGCCYANGVDLIEYYDFRFIGELMFDGDQEVTEIAIVQHPVIEKVMSAACGRVETALFHGARYKRSDLLRLQCSQLDFLKSTICLVAVTLLMRRRPGTFNDVLSEFTAQAEEILRLFKKGEDVFNLIEHVEAGLLDDGGTGPDRNELQMINTRNLKVDRLTGRLFPFSDSLRGGEDRRYG